MMVSKIMLKNHLKNEKDPAKALERTNSDICANNEMEMFVTVWAGILELSTGKLTAANAGHEYPAVKEPDGAVLVYPVVSGVDYFREGGTFSNLWCKDRPTDEELKTASLELAVDEKTAPLFLVHTSDDPGVDVRNSLLLASACRAHGLPFELHVYPHGPHGVALGNDITACGNPGWSDPRVARWVKDAAAWAEEIKGQVF